jgi:hypothetical protein
MHLGDTARTAWSVHPLVLPEILWRFRWNDLPLLPEHAASILDGREPWLRSLYLGVPAVAFVLAGASAPERRGRLMAGVAVVAVLVALGRHSPIYSALVRLLPPLGILRFPVKAMVPAALLWSLLAARGFDVWREAGAAASRRWRLWVIAPLAVVGAIALVLAVVAVARVEAWGPSLVVGRPGVSYAAVLSRPLAALALGAVLAVVTMTLAVLRRSAHALAVLVVLDLLAMHAYMFPTAPPALFTHRPEVLAQIRPVPGARVFVEDYSVTSHGARPEATPAAVYHLVRLPEGWSLAESLALGLQMYLNPPTAARWGLRGSYDMDLLQLYPEPLARLAEHLREVEDSPAHLALLRLGSVDYALALRPGPWAASLEAVADVPGLFADPIHVFRVPRPLPRTYVVGGVRVGDGERALEMLAAIDPSREVVLPAGLDSPAPAGFSGDSRIVSFRPDRVRLEATLSAPGHVVLTEAYDPGWRASLDGRAAEVLRANVGFRAVAAPAGRHEIELVYRPPAARLGVAISALAALVGLGAALRAGMRRPAR